MNKELLNKVFNVKWEASNTSEKPRSSKKRWTEEENILVVKLAFAGLTLEQISNQFEDRSIHAIQYKLKQIALAIVDSGNKYQ